MCNTGILILLEYITDIIGNSCTKYARASIIILEVMFDNILWRLNSFKKGLEIWKKFICDSRILILLEYTSEIISNSYTKYGDSLTVSL